MSMSTTIYAIYFGVSVCYLLPRLDLYFFFFIFNFFFQAEDGIRDLVRSRGLGDVYKRQDFRKTKLRLSFVKGISMEERSPLFLHPLIRIPMENLVHSHLVL